MPSNRPSSPPSLPLSPDRHHRSHNLHRRDNDSPPPYTPNPWNQNERVPIPGYHLEGGGQILRNSLALAALTSRPIHVYHIRKNRRDGGGLKRQHLASAVWIRDACGRKGKRGGVGTMAVGSKSIYFDPRRTWDPEKVALEDEEEGVEDDGVDEEGEIIPWWKTGKDHVSGETVRKVEIDVGSNGSTMLVFQALFPIMVLSAARFSPYNDPEKLLGGEESAGDVGDTDRARRQNIPKITLEIKGGTNVSWSPSFEYTKHILLPTLVRHGAIPQGTTAHLEHRGWTNGGKGKVRFEIVPFLKGEGVKGFNIGENVIPKTRTERVVKFSLTLVVPTPEELEVWKDVAGRLIEELVWDDDEEEEVVEKDKKKKKVFPEIELTTSSLASIPSDPSPADQARTSARCYYALIQLTTTSGYTLGYDIQATKKAGSSKSKSSGKLKPHQRPKSIPNQRPGSAPARKQPVFGGNTEDEEFAREALKGPVGKLWRRWEAGWLVDEFLEDQLVVWMALAEGWSCVSKQPPLSWGVMVARRAGGGGEEAKKVVESQLTLHTQTARWVAGLVALAKFVEPSVMDGKLKDKEERKEKEKEDAHVEPVKGCFGCGLKAGMDHPDWAKRNKDEEFGWMPGNEMGDKREVRVGVEGDEKWLRWVGGDVGEEEGEEEGEE